MKKYSTFEKNGKIYYRDQRTINGKRYYFYAKTPSELKKKIENKQSEVYKDSILYTENMLVSDWADIWLETYKRPYIVEKSYLGYKSVINRYITPEIGPIPINNVKNVQLQAIMTKYDLSKSYMNQIKNALTGIFGDALKNGYITKNPAIGLKIPKKATQGRRRSLTQDEQNVLLQVCEWHYAGTFCYLMYYCGLRPGECAALEWDDIDFDNGVIHITKALETGTKRIKTPKTSAGIRDVPMPEPLIQRLKLIKGTGKILKNPRTGTDVNVVDLDRWFRYMKREIDIAMGAKLFRNQITESKIVEPFNPYCLRHTYCTNLQKAGVQLNVAKYLMGHESITITAQIYTHQTDDQTENARNMINSFFS